MAHSLAFELLELQMPENLDGSIAVAAEVAMRVLSIEENLEFSFGQCARALSDDGKILPDEASALFRASSNYFLSGRVCLQYACRWDIVSRLRLATPDVARASPTSMGFESYFEVAAWRALNRLPYVAATGPFDLELKDLAELTDDAIAEQHFYDSMPSRVLAYFDAFTSEDFDNLEDYEPQVLRTQVLKEAQRALGRIPRFARSDVTGTDAFTPIRTSTSRLKGSTKRAEELLKKGLSPMQISDRLGLTANNVCKIRQRGREAGRLPLE